MNQSPREESNSSTPKGKRATTKKAQVGGVVVALLIAAYAFGQPILNDRFGLSLPALPIQSQADQNGSEVGAGGSVVAKANPATAGKTSGGGSESDDDSSAPDRSKSSTGGKAKQNSKTKPATSTDADTDDNQPADQRPGLADSRPPPTASDSDADGGQLRYGILKEISSDRYVSPEGLLYVPGSQEGHRLEHLRRHTKDQPGRRGSHGVFDGDMPGALKTIDKAYARAKKGQRTTKKVDGRRTVYTVDMGSRVGFVGGSDGARKRNPMARRVRIVLEGKVLITAFPL